MALKGTAITPAAKALIAHLSEVSAAIEHITPAEYRKPIKSAVGNAITMADTDQEFGDRLQRLCEQTGKDPIDVWRTPVWPGKADPADVVARLANAGWLVDPVTIARGVKGQHWRVRIGAHRLPEVPRR